MKSQSPFPWTGLLFPALFMLPGIAAAQQLRTFPEVRTFPGSMCQPSGHTDQISRNDLVGRMFNVDPKGTPSQFWICPILGPAIARDPAFSDFDFVAEIVVIDQSSADDISCSVCAATVNADGSETLRCNGKTTREGVPPKTNPSRVPISLGFIPPQPFPNSYNYFHCLIPPNDNDNPSTVDNLLSAVVSYRWSGPSTSVEVIRP
jgi:hypothetical protein